MKQTTILGETLDIKFSMRFMSNYRGMTGTDFTDNLRRVSELYNGAETQADDYIKVAAVVYTQYEAAMIAAHKTPQDWDTFYATEDSDAVYSAYNDIISAFLEKHQERFLHTQSGTSTSEDTKNQ